MTRGRDDLDSADSIISDDLDEVLGRANPNPARMGCPPGDVLATLARRGRPIDDPAYTHLSQCSPCYQEFRALQAQHIPGRKTHRAPSRPGESRSSIRVNRR
jgi:hypothetical protein